MLAVLDRWTNLNASCVSEQQGCFNHFLSTTTSEDDTSLYVATDETPAAIVKLDKETMSYEAHTFLGTSETTIYGLALTSTHLYAITYSLPATVIRFDKATLARDGSTGTLVLPNTDQYLFSMRMDEAAGFLYIGSLLHLLKVRLSGAGGAMERVASTVSLPTGSGTGGRNGNIGSFEIDVTYLYAIPYAAGGTGSKLVRVQHSDMALNGPGTSNADGIIDMPTINSVFASASNEQVE